MSWAITYCELARSSMYWLGCWWVDKTSSLPSIHFFCKMVILSMNFYSWLNKLHHRCFHGVLKFFEQLIEHLQMDDSALEKRTPTSIHWWKFQASKLLFLNPQSVQVTAIEILTVLLAFNFTAMTEVPILRFLQNSCTLNFAKFIWKYLYWSLSIKLQASNQQLYWHWEETPIQVFYSEYCKIL